MGGLNVRANDDRVQRGDEPSSPFYVRVLLVLYAFCSDFVAVQCCAFVVRVGIQHLHPAGRGGGGHGKGTWEWGMVVVFEPRLKHYGEALPEPKAGL